MNYLHDGLLKIGFDKGEFFGIRTLPISEIESKIEKYISNLQEFNAKFDLVNTDDHDEIVIKHILDSLSAVPELCREISERFSKTTDDFVIADIGSGAGLPGIPLSIVLPSFNFLLVERMTKRCAFLENCRSLLGLENVKIEENQAERIEQKRFDLCVFRAFRPLEKKMTKVLLRILKDGGFLAAYKARSEKITEEMQSLPSVPKYKVLSLTVPFLTENSADEERERNLVVIEKN